MLSLTGQQPSISKRETKRLKTAMQENKEALLDAFVAANPDLPADAVRATVEGFLDGTLDLGDRTDNGVQEGASAVQKAVDTRGENVRAADGALSEAEDLYRTHRNSVSLAGGTDLATQLGLTETPDRERAMFLSQMGYAEEQYGQEGLTITTRKGAPTLDLPTMATEMREAKVDLENKVEAVATSHQDVEAKSKAFGVLAGDARRVRRGLRMIFKGMLVVGDLEHLVATLHPRKKAKSAAAVERGLKAAETKRAKKLEEARTLVAAADGAEPGTPSTDASVDPPSTDAPVDVDPPAAGTP